MEVRSYRASDFSGVQEFLAAQFPLSPQKAEERFFRWRFERHPLGSALDHYQLAWEQGQLIGQMGVLRDRLYRGGKWRDCLWLVDLIVAPEHRGGLAALRLFQAAMRQSDLLLAVGAGPNLLPLYQALGWRRRAVAGTYFSVGRMSALLELAQEAGEAGPSAWRRLATLAHPGLRLLQTMGGGWRRHGDVDIVEIQRFDADTDQFIEELLPVLGVTTYRSAALLNWKFFERPQGQGVVLAARGRDGRLRGYAAVKWMRRRDATWGEIADIVAPPGEPHIFRALASATVRRSLNFHADFVRLRCSHPSQTALLRPPFWFRRNRSVIDEVLFYTKDQDLAERLLQESWHLTSFASDRTDHGRDEYSPGSNGLSGPGR